MKANSTARPVSQNPSISLIWAKCTTGGRRPRSSGPNPCDGADWHTSTVPATTPSMADFPAGATECRGVNPSASRKPPAIVRRESVSGCGARHGMADPAV
jgi:hypothetical protein